MREASGSEIITNALRDEGIRFVFGIPGAQNLELFDALDQSGRVTPVLVTDERCAAFMADGVVRASADLGCILLVPGAGLTHALSGIAEAYMDGIPMLVLATGVRSDTGKAFQLHDIDQLAVARAVTRRQFRVERGDRLAATIRTACAWARRPPTGPVIVEIPSELLIFRYADAAPDPTDAEPPPPRPLADTNVLNTVVAAIEASERPLLYVGLGSAGAAKDIVRLADVLQAPVATTFQGKGVFPEHHPLFLWCNFGPAAPDFVQAITRECDLTLAIGCRFAEVATGSYGLEPPGPLIHVDIDATVIGRNYPVDIAVISDAGELITSLLARLRPRHRREGLLRRIGTGQRTARSAWQARDSNNGGVSPQRFLTTLQSALPGDTIYAVDSGNGLFLAAEVLRLDTPRSFLAPVDFSCMGYAVPAAIGAAFACPQRTVVALEGDGALLMTGLELLTAVHHSLPVLTVVLRDRELGQIAQFQRQALAHVTASTLSDYDLSALCRALGVRYMGLSRDKDIPAVVAAAAAMRATETPVLVEVFVDYARPTYFTRGVVRTNFHRLPWPERLRFAARVVRRRLQRLL